MKKTTKTIIAALALCFVAGTTQAQNSTVSDQITAFRNAAKPDKPDFTSQAALSLRDAVLAASSIDFGDVTFVGSVESPMSDATLAQLAAKQGVGARYAQVIQKAKTADTTGWTDNDIYLFDGAAKKTAVASKNEAFTARVVSVNSGRGLSDIGWQRLFKQYRSTLPKDQQIALTAKEKEALVKLTKRTDSDNKFLTELSAELLALGLDK